MHGLDHKLLQSTLFRMNQQCHMIWTAAANFSTEFERSEPAAQSIQYFGEMEVANSTEERRDENYSPQSPKPSEPSPILTPPFNFSTIEG